MYEYFGILCRTTEMFVKFQEQIYLVYERVFSSTCSANNRYTRSTFTNFNIFLQLPHGRSRLGLAERSEYQNIMSTRYDRYVQVHTYDDIAAVV